MRKGRKAKTKTKNQNQNEEASLAPVLLVSFARFSLSNFRTLSLPPVPIEFVPLAQVALHSGIDRCGARRFVGRHHRGAYAVGDLRDVGEPLRALRVPRIDRGWPVQDGEPLAVPIAERAVRAARGAEPAPVVVKGLRAPREGLHRAIVKRDSLFAGYGGDWFGAKGPASGPGACTGCAPMSSAGGPLGAAAHDRFDGESDDSEFEAILIVDPITRPANAINGRRCLPGCGRVRLDRIRRSRCGPR